MDDSGRASADHRGNTHLYISSGAAYLAHGRVYRGHKLCVFRLDDHMVGRIYDRHTQHHMASARPVRLAVYLGEKTSRFSLVDPRTYAVYLRIIHSINAVSSPHALCMEHLSLARTQT